VNDTGDELYQLQRTLYTSRNPTRRWLHTTRRDWISAAIQRCSTRGGRTLEVGPGSGVYLPVLAEVSDEVIGADIEEAYLSRLRPLEATLHNLRLVRDDITCSRLSEGAFDLILCTEVIEHIRDSRAALAEMHRLLKPGGVLILSTPQKYSPLELCSKLAYLPGVIDVVRSVYKEPIRDTEHINLMTRDGLRSQMLQAGFTLRETHTGGVYLPLIAEFLGQRGLRVARALEPRLRGSRLEWLLWTQYAIAASA
jgi:2-polyprenyl-3-methyl-5-hydroxy-6-metoxy-1,4-benzoquinol methylase